MLRSLIPLLACPNCGSSLALINEGKILGEWVESGVLGCTRYDCEFPVEHGIPRLMPDHLLDAQKDEMQARDDQVAMYDANTFLNVFGRFELPMTFKRRRPGPTDLTLEAGCGTGRMTSILAPRVRELVSVDFSFASLLANQAKLKAAGVANVHLAQADICNLPFARELFDRALSCQVLEHVPGEEARLKAVTSIGRSVRPGATVVISAYQHSPLMGAKEGRHGGGIPFFRFSRGEFRSLLSTAFQVRSITGSLVYLYLAHCERPGSFRPEQSEAEKSVDGVDGAEMVGVVSE